MKTYVITMVGNPISEKGTNGVYTSSKDVGNNFTIERFDAITPPKVNHILIETKLTWNYPNTGSELDPWTGLRKTAYGGLDPLKRVGCALSHFLLWKKCIDEDEPILILEHDAMFIKQLDPAPILESKYGIMGINSPINATFAFNQYHNMVQRRYEELQPVPMLASKEIPQGLPGNSAYIIKPFAAKHLIDLCYRYGLWPNDAIMCRQLCDFLGVSKTYYTQVQNLRSTTTL